MGFKSIALAASTLVFSTSANAAIISVDWQSAGDNLITQDTASGLEWLDLTVTAGMSYNEVSAQLGTGGAFEGWGYATVAQVEGLWTAFGGDSAYYNGWSTQNNGLFDVMAPYVGDLVCHDQQSSCVTGQGYSWWLTETPQGGTSTSVLDVLVSSDAWTNPEAALKDYFGNFNAGPVPLDASQSELGSALVRPISAVPVPAAVWLFGSGLLGLVGVARRKKA